MPVAEKTTSADGTPIAFDRIGDGPPLILVAGAWVTRQGNAEYAQLLAEDFTVFNYDRRGRGDSGDTEPFAPEREIEDVEALIAEAGGSAHLLGFSSGAELARQVTARSVSVSRLAMFEPPYIVDDTREPVPHDYVEHIEALAQDGKGKEIFEYFMTTAIGMPPEMVRGMLDSPMVAGMEPVAHTVAYDGRIMGSTMSGKPLPAEWRDSVTAPTLVVDGGASPEWMRNGCRSLVRLLPDVAYRTLDGQDHNVAPDALVPVVRDFLGG